jgi:YHS domain-containing protein
MTAARQKRKLHCAGLVAVTCVAAALCVFASAARASLTQRIVVDWHSGLAISGYDPVAYFTDGKPMAGRPDLELSYGGVVWRFCNSGNRAAFAARPDIYMPQYGGYDPVDVARGLAVAGDPELWTIAGERLFLFYDSAQRQQFLANSARFIALSQREWPAVMVTLDP